jgi:putative membrane-bound dehydrogenase-like protein
MEDQTIRHVKDFAFTNGRTHSKRSWIAYPITAFVLMFFCSSSVAPPTQLDDIHVPEGYVVDLVAGPGMVDFPMFATLDETGRLFVFESTGNVYEKTQDAITKPQFRIKLLRDLNGDGIYDKSTIYAENVGFPQGGVFYKGSLYASSAPDLLKFTDADGDGVAENREVILTGWTLNVNANSLVGPFMGPDGYLYMTSAIMGFDVMSKEGKRLKGETARIWKVRPDGSGLEWISAGGMNNPVELTFTEAAEVIGTETYFTDPKAGQRDALVYWTEGGVYPKPNKNIDRDSLVRTGDLMPVISKYSRVAPSGIGRYRGEVFGNDFKDNLFSAQFNTHRILRHKLIRDGATFRTEDEPFFWNTNEDFHPTDVLETGEGNLLVIETGGWFIKGCPLSQVSKPELKGAIYRIRKTGAKKVHDPYGNDIPWASLSAADATTYLKDPRPFVSDRATQVLVDQAEAAVVSLSDVLKKSLNADARAKAVFALNRIGSESAREWVRTALNDSSVTVRIAAARCAGFAKDTKALEKLISLVEKDHPAVRRQSATALGKIGNQSAVPVLLASAAYTDDRFIRHALIYALITINRPVLTKKGLASASPGTKEAALIALDQMTNRSLNSSHIIPLLSGKSQSLQHTALWVMSRHPEWASDVQAFLSRRLSQNDLSEKEKLSYQNILISFSGDASVQSFMADQLKSASAHHKLLMLSVMAGTQLKQFPDVWSVQIQNLLASTNTSVKVKTSALQLVRLRGLKSMSESLKSLAADAKNPVALRTEALAALLATGPKSLSDDQFSYLLTQLTPNAEAPLQLQAASALGIAELSENQLLQLARNYLPQANAFILPRLTPVFAVGGSSEIGKAVASALTNSPALDSYSESAIQKIFLKYPDDVKPFADRLVNKLAKVHGDRIKYLQTLENQIKTGVLENGRKLFFGKAVCSACHTVGAEGGSLGPDLTSIQRDRSAHDLLEAIVYPSATFVREFETYRIKTKTQEHIGIIRERSPEVIVLHTSPQTVVRIPGNEILSMDIQDVSMMPQGLDKSLTQQEMADLMVFLLGQDQNPKTDKAFLR